MIRDFTYQALPMRVVLGPGSLGRLADEVAQLGLSRVLVVCGPAQRTSNAWMQRSAWAATRAGASWRCTGPSRVAKPR